jgi:hypothetical protein
MDNTELIDRINELEVELGDYQVKLAAALNNILWLEHPIKVKITWEKGQGMFGKTWSFTAPEWGAHIEEYTPDSFVLDVLVGEDYILSPSEPFKTLLEAQSIVHKLTSVEREGDA